MLVQNNLFKFEYKSIKASELNDIIRLVGMNIYGFDSKQNLYSELEEQTFALFNDNKGFGELDIEFVFDFGKAVIPQRFYSSCLSIRTDMNDTIKRDIFAPQACPVKVDSDGHVVIGIRYFFVNEEERRRMVDATMILVECFVAFDKKKKVLGVMGQIDKNVSDVKTYLFKPDYIRNITDLVH